MAKKIMLTQEGLVKLEEELKYLKGEKRKEMAEKIKLARSYGYLSENSEYDDAKNEQAIMEARIRDIETTLNDALKQDDRIKNVIVDNIEKMELDSVKVEFTVYTIYGNIKEELNVLQ